MVNSQSSSEHNYCSFILTWQLFFELGAVQVSSSLNCLSKNLLIS